MSNALGDLYYALGLIFIFILFKIILNLKINAKRHFKLSDIVVSKNNNEKNIRWDDKKTRDFYITKLTLTVWLIIGFLSDQWAIFATVFFLTLILFKILSKIKKFSFTYVFIYGAAKITEFLLVMFVIINHFHLHIDVTNIIASLLSR